MKAPQQTNRNGMVIEGAPVFGNDDPATSALAVVPHDVNALTAGCRALFVGTGGNITMRGVDGAADQIWKNVANGTILPFSAAYVRATGTTAADILALY